MKKTEKITGGYLNAVDSLGDIVSFYGFSWGKSAAVLAAEIEADLDALDRLVGEIAEFYKERPVTLKKRAVL